MAKAAAKGEQGEECGRGEKTSGKLAEAYQLLRPSGPQSLVACASSYASSQKNAPLGSSDLYRSLGHSVGYRPRSAKEYSCKVSARTADASAGF